MGWSLFMYERFIVKNPLRFYRQKICSIRYLHFSFEKHVPFQVLKDFSVENLETIPSTLLSKFSSEIYLSRILIIGVAFLHYTIVRRKSTFFFYGLWLYLTWGAFSLFCVLSAFFFFLSFFFFSFSICIFFKQTLTIHKIAGNGEGIIISLLFHFYQLTNIDLADRDFYHFFFIDLFCNYQSDSWWDMFYLEICILFEFSLMQLSRSYLLSYFKVTLWEFKPIWNYHPSITKRTT